MTGVEGALNETLYPTQTGRLKNELEVTHEADGCSVTSVHHEGQHPRALGHDAFAQLVVRMAGQGGVDGLLNLGVGVQAPGDLSGIPAMDGHPGAQSPHATLQQVAGVWIGRTSEVDLLCKDLCYQVLPPDHRAAHDVAMPAEIFGRGMNDDITTQCYGLATPWRGECIVNDKQEMVSFRNCRHRWNVADLEDWVRQRLDVDHLRVALNGGLIGGCVLHVGHGDMDAEPRQLFCHQSIGSPIHVSTGNHVISVGKKAKHDRRNRGHATGKELSILCPFKGANLLHTRF